MKALDDLAALLVVEPPAPAAADPCAARLAGEIATLRRRVGAGSRAAVAADLQRGALQHFWAHPQCANLKQARWVAFGLALPLRDGAPSLIENEPRFQALLQQADRWREQPRSFRRIYQGLLQGYFSCDAKAPGTAPAARANWERLRRYLDERCPQTVAPQHNPDWVRRVVRSRHLFGERPGEPYAAALLQGDFSAVAQLREQLGIHAGSWFLRELVQAQWTAAVALGDDAFGPCVARLLALLAQQPLLRDPGLRALLNRCAGLPPHSPPHDGLLQVTLRSWGDPACAPADPRWGSVDEAARTMFTGWLVQARIAAFFLQAGDGRAAMRRRAAFWQAYAPAVQRLRFGLDPRALPLPGGPLALLLRPLGDDVASLACHPAAPPRHALVMTMGALTLVEFSGGDDALHLYDSAALPFAWPGPLAVEGPPGHSLKGPGRGPPLPHADGHAGWSTWEAWFEATLKQQFDLRPGVAAPAAPVRHVDLSEALAEPAAPVEAAVPSLADQDPAEPGADAHWRTAEAAHIPYSRPDLEVFARAHGLPVEDRSAQGGGLWVLSARPDSNVGHVLARWGFVAVPGSGWRR